MIGRMLILSIVLSDWYLLYEFSEMLKILGRLSFCLLFVNWILILFLRCVIWLDVVLIDLIVLFDGLDICRLKLLNFRFLKDSVLEKVLSLINILLRIVLV